MIFYEISEAQKLDREERKAQIWTLKNPDIIR